MASRMPASATAASSLRGTEPDHLGGGHERAGRKGRGAARGVARGGRRGVRRAGRVRGGGRGEEDCGRGEGDGGPGDPWSGHGSSPPERPVSHEGAGTRTRVGLARRREVPGFAVGERRNIADRRCI
ncbi:hypothetical protein G5V59_22435 [Nocardioides sp. W3-2-3]|uniref:hypothetical protein n=1 Tax=Nocardioides convexus TaxID=2712224 RepID=UPI0024184840|nr:hypothetical protein [Nocardioides convexus]NHA01598.1 hypothetical protein [Nocardioides convexus]